MKKAFIAVALLAILLLVGCSNTEVSTTGQVIKNTELIKIGWIGPLTGDAAFYGVPVKQATDLALQEINAQGGINGKEVQIIYEDGKCNGKDATTAASKLINVDKVEVIIGGLCSAETLAFAPLAEAAQVLEISPASTNPNIKFAGDYVFRVVPGDDGQGAEAANIAFNEFKAKKIGIIYRNDEWGVALKDAFKESIKGLGGEIAVEESIEPSAGDARTQLSKLQKADVDLIYLPCFVTEVSLIIKQAKELGFDVPMLGADASKDDSLFEVAGNAAEGFIVLLPGVPNSPELVSFATKFKTMTGNEYNPYTPEAYDTTNIVFKALKATDGTGTAIKNYLYSMGPYTGASGTFEFDSYGEVHKPYDKFIVKNGEFVPYVK